MKDIKSKKLFSSGYYLILALDKKSRNKVKDRILSTPKFNRFKVMLDDK